MININLKRNDDLDKSGIKIPGLIAKENSTKGQDRNLVQEKIEELRKQGKNGIKMEVIPPSLPYVSVQDLQNSMFRTGLTDGANNWAGMWEQSQKTTPNPNGFYVGGVDPYQNPLAKPYDALPNDYYKKKMMEQELQKYFKGLPATSKPKSAFEEILDVVFTQTDKEQFLIDMGYELEVKDNTIKITRTLADGTKKTITNSLEDLFLKEVIVKFKNVLMAKATLKLKI